MYELNSKTKIYVNTGIGTTHVCWSVGGCSRNIYISYLFIIIGIDKATLLIVNSVLKEIHSLI